MTDFKLPALAADAAPEFIDAETCKAWLENIPLANVAAAQQDLLSQIEEFNRFPTRPSVRVAVLEAIREAVHFVQIEQAKRFTNRALPMAEAEAAVFTDTLELWSHMQTGYLRCLEGGGTGAGESGLRGQAATVCQRALVYAGLRMFHHYRAYREVPASAWGALHGIFAHAESLGVAEEAVKDYLNRDVHDTSPRIAYVRALLMGLANPNELAQRQLTFVAFLLERWGEKVNVVRDVPEWSDVPPLAVDIAGEGIPERIDVDAARAAALHYLDTSRLAKSLRNRVGLLRKGESPARLALGEDCVQPSCEQLLVFLYRQWCQARAQRAGERKRVADAAQACNNLEAIHYYISGTVFRQPGEQKELTKKQREEIATFGRVSTRDEDDYSQVRGFLLEHWHVEDESVQGLRMVRRAGNPGKRYAHGQLVGVRTADSKNFMLGQVRWLMSASNGDLQCGLKLLPGLPAAIAVRPTGVNAMNEKFAPAITLTAVPQLDIPPVLLLPAAWYKPKRVIEAYVEGPVRVRLLEVLERGTDFERVVYEMLAD